MRRESNVCKVMFFMTNLKKMDTGVSFATFDAIVRSGISYTVSSKSSVFGIFSYNLDFEFWIEPQKQGIMYFYLQNLYNYLY